MTIIDFDVLKSFADSFGYDIVIEKRVNGRNIAKLIKRRVQDKNGKMTTVYVKNGEEMKIHTNRNGKTVGEIDVTGKTKHLPGSKVNFSNQYGKNQSGIVIESRNNMDVIQDIHGVNHSVLHSAIQVKHLTPEANNKKIAAKDFNAAEFNRKYDDFEANGSYKGVDYALHKFINELKDSHPEIEQQINYDIKRAEEKPETISLYRIKGEGARAVYSKERQAVHKAIIQDILSKENIKKAKPVKNEKPIFIILGGRGGSGKSTFNSDKHPDSGVYSKEKVITIDPDDLKERLANLSEKEGWKGYMARAYHEESSDLSKKIMKIAISMKLNVVMDITMSNADKQIEELKLAKRYGYETSAHYMHVPKQESFRRAMHRYCTNSNTKKIDYSGRLVPPSVLLSMVDNEANFEKIKKYADNWSFWNNYIPWKNPDGTVNDAVKVSEGGKQKNNSEDASDKVKHDGEFVLTKSGSKDFGEITPEIARKIRRQAGKIRLRVGQQEGNPEDFGEKHIERDSRMRQLLSAGFTTARDFIEHVCNNFDAIYSNGRGLILAQKGEKNSKIAMIELTPSEDRDFYDVKTALIARNTYFKDNGEKKPLWEKSASGSKTDNIGERRSPLQKEAPSAISGQSDNLNIP